MKLKNPKIIETFSVILSLALLVGCGKAPETPKSEPTPATPPVTNAAAAPITPAPDATSTPVATTPTPTPAATAAAVPTSGPMRWDALPTGSKVKMDGDSTLKKWSMQSIIVAGFLEADAAFPANVNGAKAEVSMPVRSFKSGTTAMDNRMQKEMKEPEFKQIKFSLTELKPKGTSGASGPVELEAQGKLTIVGKDKVITMPITAEKQADGKLKISGTADLKMTDFGIEPPSTLGLFTSADDLKITFEWMLASAAAKAP
jgi:polyisoprenoid-binding protein YceI